MATESNKGDADNNNNSSSSSWQQMKAVLSYKSLLKLAFINFMYTACNILAATILPSFGATFFTKCDIDNDDECDLNYTEYNFYNSIFLSIQGIIAFLFTGYVGLLSDCFGRKLFIFIPILLCFIPRCLMIFNVNLFVYFAISILWGFSGGKDAIPPTFQAFVSDVIPQQLKILGFGILFASLGIGLLFGAVTSMILTTIFNNYTITWSTISVLYIISMIFVICFMKESLLPQNRKSISNINLYNPFAPLLHINDNVVTFWVCIIYFVASLPSSGIIDLMLVYISDQLSLNSSDSNLISSVVILIMGITGIFGNIVLLPIFKKYTNDINIAKIAMFSSIVWCSIFALVPYIKSVYLVIIAAFVGGFRLMAYSALNSILTSYVLENEQGTAFGVIQAAQGLTATFAPLLFGYGYNLSIEYLNFPSLPLIIALCLTIITYILIAYKLKEVLKTVDLEKKLMEEEDVGGVHVHKDLDSVSMHNYQTFESEHDY